MDISCSPIWKQDSSWGEVHSWVEECKFTTAISTQCGACWCTELNLNKRNNKATVQNLWADEYNLTEILCCHLQRMILCESLMPPSHLQSEWVPLEASAFFGKAPHRTSVGHIFQKNHDKSKSPQDNAVKTFTWINHLKLHIPQIICKTLKQLYRAPIFHIKEMGKVGCVYCTDISESKGFNALLERRMAEPALKQL